MKRAIGIVLILCGVATATISVGSQLGYFSILDSGESISPADAHADELFAMYMIVAEFLVIALGGWLIWTSRARDAA